MTDNRAQDVVPVLQIPAELRRSVPRDVVLSGAGKAARGIAIALVLAAIGSGVALYVVAVRDAARYQTIAQQSAVTQGRVTGWGAVHEGKRTVRYSLLLNGREYSGRTTLQTRSWRALPVGTEVAVRYLPAQPQENWIVGHEPRGVPFLVVGLAPLSLLFAPVLIAVMLHRERAFLAEGRPALARVTRVKRVHGNAVAHGVHHFQPQGGYRVWYEFSDLSGARHVGRANMGKNVPPEGSPLVIVYNIDEPRRSAPYPLPHVCVAAP